MKYEGLIGVSHIEEVGLIGVSIEECARRQEGKV
jgi:hypothetical protein